MKARRQGLNDLDRFKLMKAKSARNKILAKAVAIKINKMSKAEEFKKIKNLFVIANKYPANDKCVLHFVRHSSIYAVNMGSEKTA